MKSLIVSLILFSLPSFSSPSLLNLESDEFGLTTGSILGEHPISLDTTQSEDKAHTQGFIANQAISWDILESNHSKTLKGTVGNTPIFLKEFKLKDQILTTGFIGDLPVSFTTTFHDDFQTLTGSIGERKLDCTLSTSEGLETTTCDEI